MKQEFMNLCGFIIALVLSVLAIIAIVLGLIAIIAELHESYLERKVKTLEYKKRLERQKELEKRFKKVD
ncbi:MAG: hypothetical protein NC299_12870 [Lachnospiraceae bacterium]|nr:hypothetical protein [Ruminococcus sp.]MCM1276230.1 hypothetical protein [Lachnospiraceae bacterium]